MALFEEASPICRGKNLSWETVLLFFNNLPRYAMPKAEFNSYVESRINAWTQTHSQIARQLAFYYEENGICYPRFTQQTSLLELFEYMKNWATIYFIPNPYAPSLRGYTPTCIYSFIAKSINEGKTDFDEILDSIFQVKLSSHDKVNVYLSNFTDLLIDSQHQVSFNDKIDHLETELYPEERFAIDPRLYFEYFTVIGNKIHNLNSKPLNQPQQQIYRPYLTAIKSKPFLLLAGISGTGKSRIVRELAFMSCPKYLQDKDGVTPGNYCMIEVKPNWHDSTELLGYYSNISREYLFKKFVKFLVKAKMHPEVPFFVCLDEMNLAPVEQYFAEILSILETRKHPKTDEGVDMKTIKTEVLVEPQHFKYHSYKDESGAIREKLDMTDKDWYETFCGAAMMTEEERELINRYQYSRTLQQEGLSLPDNVIIIGTVNMDETTHQFSRKVIDRAMTIEMNGGRLVDMFGGSGRLEYLPEEQQQKWQAAFRQRYVCADEVLELHPEVANDIRTKLPARLEEINKALRGTPFEVSYRVLNELTIMVGVMLDDNAEGKDIDAIISEAIDNILLMKILPRVEGDSDMFELSGMEKKKHGVEYDNRLKWLLALAPEITVTEEEGANHRQTAKGKIQEMIDRLDSHEFTRYWP